MNVGYSKPFVGTVRAVVPTGGCIPHRPGLFGLELAAADTDCESDAERDSVVPELDTALTVSESETEHVSVAVELETVLHVTESVAEPDDNN